MTLAPRFVKYQTESGRRYVFDPGTNEIVEVGEVIYEILDAFCVLEDHEVIRRYRPLGEAAVREALAELHKLQAGGVLCDGHLRVSARAENAVCDGRPEEPLDQLLASTRNLLTLELTEACNLRCEYCCYGEHYHPVAKRDNRVMSLQTARDAVTAYIDLRPKMCAIGFYGGEPLLEFELLREIVAFAEDYATERELEPRFNITTNGTLLNDEVLHFLVKHSFNVLISLDGDKQSHDRYRVFADANGEPSERGTFDVVMGNLRRFVDLYPDYRNRGIALTLTATADHAKIDALIRQLRPAYPSVVVSPVLSPTSQETAGRPCDFGSCGVSSCSPAVCFRAGGPETGVKRGWEPDTLATTERPAAELPELPDFADWSGDRMRSAGRSKRFQDRIRQNPDQNAVEEASYLDTTILRMSLLLFHGRDVRRGMPDNMIFPYRCFPGVSRLFCSVDGVYYPCERLDRGPLFELGNTVHGVDVKRVRRLVEKTRLLGDCLICVARETCSLCPALLVDAEGSGTADAFAFQKECQETIRLLPALLKTYTALMESDQDFMDRFLDNPFKDELSEVASTIIPVPTDEQLTEIDPGLEESEVPESLQTPSDE